MDSIEIQRAIIMGCLQDNRRIDQVLGERVKPESFADKRIRVLWEGVLSTFKKLSAVDEMTLFENMKSTPYSGGKTFLEALGGVSDYAELTEDFPTTGFSTILRLFVESDQRRVLRESCMEALDLVDDMSMTISEAAAGAEQQILSASAFALGKSKEMENEEAVSEALQRILDVNEGKQEIGISSGFKDIDRVIGYLRPGMITLAARPGVGKTAIALSMILRVASQGKRVMLFSLEMTREEIYDRMLYMAAGVSKKKAVDRMLSQGDIEALRRAEKGIAGLDLLIFDDTTATAAQIRSCARSANHRSELGLVVVDYLQIVEPGNRRNPREQQVAEISGQFRAMAKELNRPCLILAQINREIEKNPRWPNMSDLRESGSIEQDSSVVAFLSRFGKDGEPLPNTGNGMDVDFVVAKNRGWSTGDCKLTFRDRFARYDDHAFIPPPERY